MKKRKTTQKVIGTVVASSLLLTPFISQVQIVSANTIQQVNQGMSATLPDGTNATINGINQTRGADQIVVYTSQSLYKQQNQWSADLVVDRDGKVVRKTLNSSTANNIIPERGYILSGNGKHRDVLNKVQVGDSITLTGVNLINLNSEASHSFTAFNKDRDTNEMIAYTPEWGDTTGTNNYGTEVVVKGSLEDATIVAFGGNNSAIPADGYVLSGHGKSRDFLNANAQVGAKVSVKDGQVTIKVTPDTIIESAETEVNKATAALQHAKDSLYDIPVKEADAALQEANELLAKSKELREQLQTNDTDDLRYNFRDTINEVRHRANVVQYRSMESRVVEARSIWHRPIEQNINDIHKTLKQMQDSNVNMLFLETYYHGFSIFPSENPDVKQNPNFVKNTYGEYGNDLLKAFIETAKEYDIQVSAWTHSFFVGHDGAYGGIGSPLLEKYPDWFLVNYDNTLLSKQEGGKYYFADPAHPGYRQHLLGVYSELATKYPGLDSIQLDYIRYNVGSYKNDSGYGVTPEGNKSSMEQFKIKYDIPAEVNLRDVLDKDKNEDWEQWWKLWNEFKVQQVTSFVEEAHDVIQSINPNIELSTAIFPEPEEALGKKQQDWMGWVQSGLIDLTMPMAYYTDAGTVKKAVGQMNQFTDGKTYNYAGIAPTYLSLPAENNAFQTRAAQEAGAHGSSLFASQSFLNLPDVQEALKESTFRKDAIVPHAPITKVVEVSLADVYQKVEGIYIPAGAMTKHNAKKLKVDLNRVAHHIDRDVDKAIHELEKVQKQINKYAQGAAKERLQEQFDYLHEILSVRSSLDNK